MIWKWAKIYRLQIKRKVHSSTFRLIWGFEKEEEEEEEEMETEEEETANSFIMTLL